jgi:hypothetical protein
MIDYLKPCPCCEGPARAVETITQGSVTCTVCGLDIACYHGRITDDGLADAKAIWNRRPEYAATIARLARERDEAREGLNAQAARARTAVRARRRANARAAAGDAQ